MNLKLCPFCGSEAYSYKYTKLNKGIQSDVWTVHCKGCKLNYPIEECKSEEEAIRIWNKRNIEN